MSQETTLNKSALQTTLGILLDLGPSAVKDLGHLQKATLQEMYDNYIINAKHSNQSAFNIKPATSRHTSPGATQRAT
jgi:hypothetical protein